MGKYKEILINSRKKYVKGWESDAKFFFEQGLYNWMALPLQKYKTVLEIGCGSGLSTLALIQNGHYVISIDENIECLKKTKKLLDENNIKSRIIKREILFKENKNSYMYNFSKIMVNIDESEILLIEGDVCGDENLEIWLSKIKIDCIVIWLMGSHGARSMNQIIAEKNIKSPQDYRFIVQSKVYEIADKILDKGGILSIVDRCRTPKDKFEKSSFIDFFSDQTSITSLEITKIEFKEYKHDIEDGVEMSTENGIYVERYESLSELQTSLVLSIAEKK